MRGTGKSDIFYYRHSSHTPPPPPPPIQYSAYMFNIIYDQIDIQMVL